MTCPEIVVCDLSCASYNPNYRLHGVFRAATSRFGGLIIRRTQLLGWCLRYDFRLALLNLPRVLQDKLA